MLLLNSAHLVGVFSTNFALVVKDLARVLCGDLLTTILLTQEKICEDIE